MGELRGRWQAHLCPHLFAMVYEGELAAVWGHIFVQSGRAGDRAEACPTNASIAALGWTGRRPGALICAPICLQWFMRANWRRFGGTFLFNPAAPEIPLKHAQ